MAAAPIPPLHSGHSLRLFTNRALLYCKALYRALLYYCYSPELDKLHRAKIHVRYTVKFVLEFYNLGSGIKSLLLDCKFAILSLSNFTKRELNFPKRFLNNINYKSRLVKLLREVVVNLQSGIEYLFQILDCEIPPQKIYSELLIAFIFTSFQLAEYLCLLTSPSPSSRASEMEKKFSGYQS